MYGEKLIDLRYAKKLKQYEVAKILDIYKGVYNQYETEYVIIPIKHLNTLCNYFNTSLDYIFDFTKTKKYRNYKLEIYKKISGQRLKELRNKNKLTQTEFATILKVSRTTIAEYERGTNIIATPFLYTICIKYKISADYLLGKIDKQVKLKINATKKKY